MAGCWEEDTVLFDKHQPNRVILFNSTNNDDVMHWERHIPYSNPVKQCLFESSYEDIIRQIEIEEYTPKQLA